MKTLGKLKINPEKILKNEELKSLNGGWCGRCEVYGGNCQYNSWPACGDSQEQVQTTCQTVYASYGGCTCNCGWGT